MPALPGTSLPRPTSTALGASGGGVAGSGGSLLSALCGQDARAPRNIAPKADLNGIGRLGRGCGRLGRVAPLGALRAFGPLRARCPRSQDIAHRATPWERGRPARKRATGPPHGQAGDAHALGLLQCQSSAVHPRPTSTALGASGGGVAGSGVSLLSALRARCPRSQGHRSQGPLGARASRPQAGHRPATLPSGRRPRSRASPAPVLGSAPKADLDGIVCLGQGSSRLGRVASVSALRAFGPLRARCPRSQGHRSQDRPRRHWAPRAGE